MTEQIGQMHLFVIPYKKKIKSNKKFLGVIVKEKITVEGHRGLVRVRERLQRWPHQSLHLFQLSVYRLSSVWHLCT